VNENRKLSRFPCNLEATCETIEGTPPAHISSPVTVMNLSTSGVCLAVSRQFQQGAVLFLKLANPNKTYWCGRSARVIHTQSLPAKLLLGCQFTVPITESELHTLLGHGPAPERRMNHRFVPSSDTLGHLVVKLRDHDMPVILNDISVGGICLAVNQQFADGTLLQAELTNTVNGTHCVMPFRLLHVRKAGTNWTVGGGFLEKMVNQDLLALLA